MAYDWFNPLRSIAQLIGLRTESERVQSAAPEPEPVAIEIPLPHDVPSAQDIVAAVPDASDPEPQDGPTVAASILCEELDQEGRRKLIRQLFNDFWSGIDDKPATFADRLNSAEDYINQRLAEQAVGWRLDAVTRKQLGLPSSRASTS